MNSPKTLVGNIDSFNSMIDDNEYDHEETITNLIKLSHHAFEYIKKKYNKNKVNVADSLEEFIGYEGTDNNHYTSLFSLAFIMTYRCKTKLDTIDENNPNDLNVEHNISTFNKIMRNLVKKFENRIDTMVV
tara:strand:+ start:1072 stop:1464 length:393 start_codon:yes stop_codon:yes gene_type:complete